MLSQPSMSMSHVSQWIEADGKMKGFLNLTFMVLYVAMKYLRLNTITEKVADK